jgi:hypothetical protein
VFMHVLVLLAVLLTSLALVLKLLAWLAVLFSLATFVRRQKMLPVFRLYRDQNEWRLVAQNVATNPSKTELNGPVMVSSWCFGVERILPSITNFFNAYFPCLWVAGNTYQVISWSYCSQYLLVIRIETERNRLFYFPVMFDSCHPDEFRWLKVVVKYLL